MIKNQKDMSLNKSNGNMYPGVKTWNPLGGECPHKCSYCLDGNTLIMMGDFTQKPIKDIKIGDVVIGMKQDKTKYTKFTLTKVTKLFNRNDLTLKITTGESFIICTREHELMGSTSIRNNGDWRQARIYSPYDTIKYVSNKSRGQFSMEHRIGYLRGVIDGDGCICVRAKSKKRNKKWLGFDMVCIDEKLRNHVKKEALEVLGVTLRDGVKKVAKNGWGSDCSMITCTTTEEVIKLRDKTEFRLNIEFAKGYLAGMIDTDGSVGVNKGTIRIAQSKVANSIKYQRIKNCLELLCVPYVEEINVIRILSDFETRMRFLFDFGVYHSYKSERLLIGSSSKGAIHSGVISVEKYDKIEVFNIATETENYIANGFVVHNCSTKSMMRYPVIRAKYSGPLTFYSGYPPFEDKTVFVCGQNDLFADKVPLGWISEILKKCWAKENVYLFQSKNPKRFKDFLGQFPPETILCTTIETNRHYDQMGEAPSVLERAFAMSQIEGITKQVTIEPIMDFDLRGLVQLIKICNPVSVNIGADSKHNHLPEPSKEKVLALIDELQKFTIIDRKTNLQRLLK